MFTPDFFEHGPKSIILCLFLTLALHGKASDARWCREYFGCDFADDECNMKLSDNKQPVWGDNNTNIESVQLFRNKDNFSTDITFNLFSEYNIMNELSLFTRFVNDYKKSNLGTYLQSQTLKSFFNKYTVPYVFKPKAFYQIKALIRRTTDPTTYLIQELQYLKTEYRRKYTDEFKTKNTEETRRNIYKKVSPYLVSAYVDPIEFPIEFNLNFSNPSIYDNVDKLLHKPVQDHVAAVIKTYHGTRNGYILIDPGYANGKKLYHPFIVHVMDDGKPPHGEFLAGSEHNNKIIEFSVGGSKDKSFILAKRKWSKTVRHVLYYADKAYCSFMEHTVKANLLRLNHGIIARQLNEKKKASYLTMKISPEFKGFSIRADLYNAPNNERITKNATEAGNYIGNSFDPGDYPGALLRSPIPISPEDRVSIITEITEQLKLVQSDVLAKAFMNMFSKLAKNLGVDKDLPEDFFVKDDDRIEEPNSPIEEPDSDIEEPDSPIGVTGKNMNRQKPKSGSGLGSLCCITRPKVDD
uniref:Uncharacterized protein n=1 Tax=Cacopsylla melanoneura TaxID=428564 RepID=A0A8D8ZP22_9HEMI